MIARYPGACSECGAIIQKGEECEYQAATKTIRHYDCHPRTEDAEELATRLGYKRWTEIILLPLPPGD